MTAICVNVHECGLFEYACIALTYVVPLPVCIENDFQFFTFMTRWGIQWFSYLFFFALCFLFSILFVFTFFFLISHMIQTSISLSPLAVCSTIFNKRFSESQFFHFVLVCSSFGLYLFLIIFPFIFPTWIDEWTWSNGQRVHNDNFHSVRYVEHMSVLFDVYSL